MPSVLKVNLANPTVLKWAREEVGLTKKEVADRFRKTEAIISSWEDGSNAPTFRQLSELANYYKRPVAIFFFPDVPPASPKPVDHRTLPGLSMGRYSKLTLIAYRELYNMLEDVTELFGLLDNETVFSIPNWTMKDNPEEKAMMIRNSLGITIDRQIKEMTTYNHALDVWRSVLFDKGIVVRVSKMPIEDARAFCLFRNKLAGIGLSNEDRDHGKIFSLFHELCHLGLRKPGVSGLAYHGESPNREIEDYCDKFAASFLLPSSSEEVTKSLKEIRNDISYENTRRIGNKFKVSKYVVIRRALDLGIMSPDVYWSTYNELHLIDSSINKPSQENKKGNYYATQISYNGKRFVSLAMDALYKNKINALDVKRIVGLTPSAIEQSL